MCFLWGHHDSSDQILQRDPWYPSQSQSLFPMAEGYGFSGTTSISISVLYIRDTWFKPSCVPRLSGFPGGASDKESACQCRRQKRVGSNPWLGKIPGRRKWQPTLVSLPGESPGQRAGYSHGLDRVGHDWCDFASTLARTHPDSQFPLSSPPSPYVTLLLTFANLDSENLTLYIVS